MGCGVECPDCKRVVDKLDVHLRVGCRALLESVSVASGITRASLESESIPAMTRLTESPQSVENPRVSPVRRHRDVPQSILDHTKSTDSQSFVITPFLSQPLCSRSYSAVKPLKKLDIPPPPTRIPGSVIPGAVDLSPILSSSIDLASDSDKSADVPPVLGRTALVEPAEKRRKLSPKPTCLPNLNAGTECSQKSIRLFGGEVINF